MAIIDTSEARVALGLDASITDAERVLLEQCKREAEAAVIQHLGYAPQYASRTWIGPGQFPAKMPRDVEGLWEPNAAGTEASLTLSGMQFGQLQLPAIPVRSLTSVFVDESANFGAASGAFAPATAKSIGSDVYPMNDGADDDGNLVCQSGLIVAEFGWPSAPGTVKIVYVAGYTPEELHGQTLELNAGGILSALLETLTMRLHTKIRYQRKTRTGIFTPGNLLSETMGSYSYTVEGGAGADDLTGMKATIPDSAALALEPFINWGEGVV